jgi:hypothetical protein
VLLSGIRTQVVFEVAQEGNIKRTARVSMLWRGLKDTPNTHTPEKDLDDYLEELNRPAQFSIRQSEGGVRFDYTPDKNVPKVKVSVTDRLFRLPVLRPPEYVGKPVEPNGLNTLAEAAKQAAERYLLDKRVSLVLPCYSSQDPETFVLIESPNEPDAVFFALNLDGSGTRWTIGRPFPNAGQEDLGDLISKIRRGAIKTLKIPD